MNTFYMWMVEVSISGCSNKIGHPIQAEDSISAKLGGEALYPSSTVQIANFYTFVTSNQRWLVEGILTQNKNAMVLIHIIFAKSHTDAQNAGDILFPSPGKVVRVTKW